MAEGGGIATWMPSRRKETEKRKEEEKEGSRSSRDWILVGGGFTGATKTQGGKRSLPQKGKEDEDKDGVGKRRRKKWQPILRPPGKQGKRNEGKVT